MQERNSPPQQQMHSPKTMPKESMKIVIYKLTVAITTHVPHVQQHDPVLSPRAPRADRAEYSRPFAVVLGTCVMTSQSAKHVCATVNIVIGPKEGAVNLLRVLQKEGTECLIRTKVVQWSKFVNVGKRKNYNCNLR